ncbi:MAG TPA: hypothetical protein VE422_40440 [Terriglobia bacterium]|nr:hypothetical protein [Terriglobia bacterium]
MDSFSHPFYDIDIERLSVTDEIHLVKILSIDGRRFTYELRGPLTKDAITFMKGLIDAAVFGDLIIEPTAEGLEARESPARLKKHS